jgi:hypothetical protein
MFLKTGLFLGIDKLRGQADFTSYEPAGSAPNWLKQVAKVSRDDLGTLAVLGPSGISIRASDQSRTRLYPDPASLSIITLSNFARGKRKRLALSTPPFARHFPLLLASSALLASTLEHAGGSNRDGSVLVVSRDLDIRSRYCDVFVHKQLLDDAHPGSRMRPNGERVFLRSQVHDKDHAGGVCFFLPEVTLPASIQFAPALIILDLRYARWTRRAEGLASWAATVGRESGVIALYSVGDYDTSSALFRTGFLDVPFDHSAVSTCLEGYSQQSPPNLSVDCSLTDASSISSRRHEIIEVPEADNLEKIYTQTAKLLYEQEASDNSDFNRARWILAILAQLPVPLTWYEFTSRDLGRSTLKRMIETLGYKSQRHQGAGPIIQTVRMQLEHLYNVVESVNPRPAALQKLLEHIATRHPRCPILLLVRDRVTEQAVESWLAVHASPNAEWLHRLEVRGCPVYSEIANRRYEIALVNGAFPRRYRWIAGAALASDVCFLAYPHETDIIEKQLLMIYGAPAIENRFRSREASVARMFDAEFSRSSMPPDQGNSLNLQRPPRRSSASSAVVKGSVGLAGLAEALEAARAAAVNESRSDSAWEFDPGEQTEREEIGINQGDSEPLAPVASICFNIHSRLHGSGKLYLPVGNLVDCVRPSDGESVLRLEVDKIKVGDFILNLSERAARETLFDQLVRLAEGQPEMDYLADFRKTWREAIQKISAKFRSPSGFDYAGIFLALKAAGAPIESEQAVRFWVHEQVIGPEAIASIQAVGKLSGSNALASQAKQFDRAFRKIRGLHQGIGRKLSGAIRESFRHVHFGHVQKTTEQMDDRLGIPLDELLDTIDFAEVVSINAFPEEISAQHVNEFRPVQ